MRREVRRFLPVMLVALAALLAGCFGGAQTGVGTLVVESIPGSAKVLLNGEDTGEATPAELKNVRAGTHEVTVLYEGLPSQTQTVSVRRGRTTVVEFVLTSEMPAVEPGHAVVTGIVSENPGGRNVLSATVTAYEAGTDSAVGSTVTDAGGRYYLVIPAGTYDIVVDKDGHARGKRQSLTLEEGDYATAHLIAKPLRDPEAGAPVAPDVAVFIGVPGDDGLVFEPFEPGMFVPFADVAVGRVEVEAAHDMYRIQVRVGHRDAAADFTSSILQDELVFGLGDLLPLLGLPGVGAPGETSLVVSAYDYHNNWTEVVIPFTFTLSDAGGEAEPVALDPVDRVEVTAVTYGTDLELYRRQREDIYSLLGIGRDPAIQDLGDGLYVDLSRLDKDVTMYTAVTWSPVFYQDDGDWFEAAGYEIQRSFEAPGRWETIALLNDAFRQPPPGSADPNPYFDMSPELRPGRRVYYRVRGIGPNGETGPWSEPVYTIPLDRLEVRLVSPSHGATNVPLQPTLRWTHTDVGADAYRFHGFVAGVTGEPGGLFDFFAWYFEDLVNQTEVVYNYDGTGQPLKPAHVYQWNVVDVEASAWYGPNSRAVAFAGSGVSETGYAGAANGEFQFMTTAEAQ